MRSILACSCLLILSVSALAQLFTPSGSVYTAGNFGINVSPTQFPLEVQGSGMKVRNTAASGYTTFRLYNDQNNIFRTLEVAYGGSTFTGPLLTGGPTGESGSIAMTGSYPLSFGTANTARLTITGAGNVGIGITNPQTQFEVVSGNRAISFNNTISGVTTGGILAISRPDDGMKTLYLGPSAAPTTDNVIYGSGGGSELRLVSGGLASGGFGFYINMTNTTAFASARPTPVMKIDGLGNVGIGIGTNTPDAKLSVGGTVHSREVIVNLSGAVGPDYVFAKDYSLPSLDEVKAYIDQHQHLPEVPSAKEMEENGIKVGEMNLLLLKKIEELTLYVIELKNENIQQSKEIAEMKSKK